MTGQKIDYQICRVEPNACFVRISRSSKAMRVYLLCSDLALDIPMGAILCVATY
jgi:hypothetical protein